MALDVADHVWELSDRPEALALLKESGRFLLPPKAEAAAAKIRKDLAAIEAYNRERGPG